MRNIFTLALAAIAGSVPVLSVLAAEKPVLTSIPMIHLRRNGVLARLLKAFEATCDCDLSLSLSTVPSASLGVFSLKALHRKPTLFSVSTPT